jgi:hypothetical protein
LRETGHPVEVAGLSTLLACLPFSHLASLDRPRPGAQASFPSADARTTRRAAVVRGATTESALHGGSECLFVSVMTALAPVLRIADNTALRIARQSQRQHATTSPGTPGSGMKTVHRSAVGTPNIAGFITSVAVILSVVMLLFPPFTSVRGIEYAFGPSGPEWSSDMGSLGEELGLTARIHWSALVVQLSVTWAIALAARRYLAPPPPAGPSTKGASDPPATEPRRTTPNR